MLFKIRGRDLDDPVYWSNTDGWVSAEDADVFSQEERNAFNLPTDGEWVEFEPSKRKFTKVTITINLLAEDPPAEVERQLVDTELAQIVEQMDSGDLVGEFNVDSYEELDAMQVVEALGDVGSEASFFRLNEDGSDMED